MYFPFACAMQVFNVAASPLFLKKAAIYARPVAGVNAIDLNDFRLLPEPEQICPGGLRWPEEMVAVCREHGIELV